MKKIILLLALLFSLPSFAIEGIYQVIIKKQEEKKSTRWSLVDWLSTKKKIALMDQWLALNSSKTLFEASISATQGDVKERVSNNPGLGEVKKTVQNFEATLFVRMVGLSYMTGDYSSSVSQSEANLQLLLLGSSIQSTHIRAFYGLSQTDITGISEFKGNHWGAIANLYLASFLGVDFRYSKTGDIKGENKTFEMSKERISWGPFLEFSFLRAGFSLYKEKISVKENTSFSKSYHNEGGLMQLSVNF